MGLMWRGGDRERGLLSLEERAALAAHAEAADAAAAGISVEEFRRRKAARLEAQVAARANEDARRAAARRRGDNEFPDEAE